MVSQELWRSSIKGGDDTCCSASSPLPRRASPETTGCEALGTTDPHPRGWRSEREPRSRLPAPRRSGARGAWYGQPRGTAVSVVNKGEPKVLTGSDQNGKWPGPDAADSSGADDAPPALRRGL